MEIFLFVLGLIIGGLIGIGTTYYFTIILPRPKLEVMGSCSFGSVDYNSFGLAIGNERRRLGIRSPLPFISYKFGKTHIGNRTYTRNAANQCMATLCEKDGHQICNLWWQRLNGEIADTVNVECGRENQVNLPIFMRSDDKKGYFVYQPQSEHDHNPKISNIPHFTVTKKFLIKISYEYGEQEERYQIEVRDNYDDTFTVIAPGSMSPL